MHSRRWRMSLKTLLVVFTIVALVGALIAQSGRLAVVQRALNLHEQVHPFTAPPEPGKMRVSFEEITRTDHLVIAKYRIETNTEHFATVANDEGDSAGSVSHADRRPGIHVSELVVVLDYISSQNCVKMSEILGGARGYTIMPVAEDYRMRDAIKFEAVSGEFPRGQQIDLFRWDGKRHWLLLKP